MAGYTPETFAVALLRRLGAPASRANVRAIVGWEGAEGGHWHNNARFNPLNTTQPMPGAGNTGTQGNIKVYRSAQQGLDATVRTLRNGRYGGILSALRRGNNPGAVARAIGQSPWGTSASLVSSVIGGTPAPKSIPSAGGLGGGQGGAVASSTTTTDPGAQGSALALLQALTQQRQQPQSAGLQAPAFSAAPALPKSFQQVQGGGGPQPQPDMASLLAAVQTPADAGGSSTTTQVSGAGGSAAAPTAAGGVTSRKGVVRFDGKPVDAWIAPILRYGREHGWTGGVNSGYRSDAEQTAIYKRGVRPAAVPISMGGHGSNHEFKAFPGGAVDVSNAAQLAQILRRSPYAHLLVYAGSKDPVHFSHPHNGAY